jgi:DNA-binding IclR family transcriptional regulator
MTQQVQAAQASLRVPIPVDTHRYTVPALARGLQLLNYFTHDQRELTGAHLAHLTRWPRTSVFRMLQTLEQMEYIERCGEEPLYRLGMASMRLGFEYLAGQELAEQGQPILDALSQDLHLTAHLAIRHGREAVFVAKSTASIPQIHSIAVGTRVPLHATSVGSILLGGITMAALQAMYAGLALTRHSGSTPATLDMLKSTADADTIQGYSICQGCFESGISSIAVPVYNQHHKVCAVMNITLITPRMDASTIANLVNPLKQAASALGRRISHLPKIAPS